MALENLTGPDVFITNLVQANPTVTDPVSQGDDHLRGIKNVLLNSFPNINAPLTVSSADINGFAPLASPAFTGVPTAPTAAAGTDTTQLATTAFVKAAVAASPSVGVDQTWQDVTASRASGTTYTNTTGKPIQITVTVSNSSGTHTVALGAVTYKIGSTGTTGGSSVASNVIPDGTTYSVTVGGGGAAITKWLELR